MGNEDKNVTNKRESVNDSEENDDGPSRNEVFLKQLFSKKVSFRYRSS